MGEINLLFGIVAALLYWHASAKTNLMQRRQIVEDMLGVAQKGFFIGLIVCGLFEGLVQFGLIVADVGFMDYIRLAAYGIVIETTKWYVPRFVFGNQR